MNTKLPAGTLEKLWADPHNWRAGVIYVCKDDPRLTVPKRRKWGGWTVNFAHTTTWLLLLVVILAAAVPAAYLAQTRPIDVWGWVAFVVGYMAFVCALNAVLASPKWYESAGE
jgi:hypothetical protein